MKPAISSTNRRCLPPWSRPCKFPRMTHILPYLLLMAAGMLSRHVPSFPGDTDKSLNLYVIYIALPALILVQIPRLHFSSEILIPVVMAWATLGISALLVLMVSRLLKWSDSIKGAMLLMVPLGNTSFLGIPMVEHFFGEAGIPHAIIYDQFGSFMALSTYGTVILAIYGQGTRVSAKEIARKIITFPPFIALTVALAFHPLNYPEWLGKMLEMGASSLVPVVLVAIGFAMRIIPPGREIVPLFAGLSIRLLLTPIIIIGICTALDMHGEVTRVSILESAMPPMVSAGALASIAGLEPRLTASMVGIGILASFITLQLIFMISG